MQQPKQYDADENGKENCCRKIDKKPATTTTRNKKKMYKTSIENTKRYTKIGTKAIYELRVNVHVSLHTKISNSTIQGNRHTLCQVECSFFFRSYWVSDCVVLLLNLSISFIKSKSIAFDRLVGRVCIFFFKVGNWKTILFSLEIKQSEKNMTSKTNIYLYWSGKRKL